MCACGVFSWHTLGPSVPTEHCFNAAAFLRVVVDHAGCRLPGGLGHKAQIISNWILGHDSEPAVAQRPPQAPDLSPVEVLLMEVQTPPFQYGPKSPRNVSNSLKASHEEKGNDSFDSQRPARSALIFRRFDFGVHSRVNPPSHRLPCSNIYFPLHIFHFKTDLWLHRLITSSFSLPPVDI